MRIIINRKLLKEKKYLKPISERGKGGGSCSIWRSLVQYLSGNIKWQYQMAVKVFFVNLVILKNKIMYFWLDIE